MGQDKTVDVPGMLKVVMLPSVGGGIGHLSRTAALARALAALDSRVQVEYLLDTERLRPFNIDACRLMGFRPRFLPPRNRDNRDAIVRACLDDANVIVDDCSRYLQPLSRCVPQAAWVSIPMHPIGDELFMDWPNMAQMDLILWAYAPLVGVPTELDVVADRLVETGPFLETEGVPGRTEARRALGLRTVGPHVTYAPRGFPFGREFGHRVLASVFGAIDELRQSEFPDLELVLLAVGDPSDLKGVDGVPETLPDWVRVEGVVTPAQSLLHASAADIVIGEGTSTMHEAAALRSALVLMPGPIREAELLAQGLARESAASTFTRAQTTVEALMAAFRTALTPGRALENRLDRARELVTGGGGARRAAEAILGLSRPSLLAKRIARRSDLS